MTIPDKIRHSDLSIEQRNAIDLLIQGQTDEQVAEAVGVTRQTVCQWRNNNSEFIAELNTRRKEVWSSQDDRIRHLQNAALEVMEDALNSEDENLRLKAAIQISRGRFTDKTGGSVGQEIA